MAITIVTRPVGHKLSSTPNVATITAPYTGFDASFVNDAHGLVDGDHIYATSLIEDYNGFFYVDQVTADNFKLKYGSGGDFVQWVADGGITYYVSTARHGWSCVHLPIVYKLSSSLWPTNSADPEQTVSSFTDSNGYVNLNLSGALNASVNDLNYIKISGASDDALNGVFQITDAVSTSDVTISLSYDAGYDFTGATVQYYYNNYHIKVKLFGGLGSDQQFEYLKPYEELAIINLVPDENGEVMFSVSEYLKSQINIRNNTLLASLPTNIDFYTQFYIEVAEAYDNSDGTTIATEITSYTSDQNNFEGFAAGSKLAFKNMYSGYLTEYVIMANSTGAKFLTLFTTGVLFLGCTNELDFIYDNGIDAESGYSQTNVAGQADWDTSTKIVNIEPGSNPSNYLYKTNQLHIGSTYRIRYNISGSGTYTTTIPGNPLYVNLAFLDNTLTSISGVTILSAAGSSVSVDSYVDVEIPANTAYIGFSAIASGNVSTGGFAITINSLAFEASGLCVREEKYLDGALMETTNIAINGSSGIYRHFITPSESFDEYVVSVHTDEDSVTPLSEEFTFEVKTDCAHQELYLTWLNNLGGFDYWNFTAKKDHLIEIQESGITKQNIFPTWPQSYGAIADTVRKQTFRTSNKAYTVRSQLLTLSQVESISFIKSSILTQVITARTDRRTVLVDDSSFMIRKDQDDTFSIAFNISFNDDIPVQTV